MKSFVGPVEPCEKVNQKMLTHSGSRPLELMDPENIVICGEITCLSNGVSEITSVVSNQSINQEV